MRKLMCSVVVLAGLTMAGCLTPSMVREDGDVAYFQGDYATAAEHYARAAELQPTDALAHYKLGRTHLQLDRNAAAELNYRTAWTLQPNNEELTPKILDGLAESLVRQPEREWVLYDYLEEQAQMYGTPEAYLRQAEYLMQIGDADNAVVAHRKAVFFASRDDATTLLAMGDFYLEIGDNAQAERYYRYAFALDPEADGLSSKLRGLGVVPGPTAGLPLPPEIRPVNR